MAAIRVIEDYPASPKIIYKNPKRTFRYTILEEGIVPPKAILCQTKRKNYKIPTGYLVETSWGYRTIRCRINYINDKPIYSIRFGPEFSQVVISHTSSSDAATKFNNVSNNIFKKMIID